MTLTMIEGDVCEVYRMFGADRAIVFIEPGVPAIAVLTSEGWSYLTGEPARPGEEEDAYNALLAGGGTTVDVTAPDGTTTTFKDPEDS